MEASQAGVVVNPSEAADSSFSIGGSPCLDEGAGIARAVRDQVLERIEVVMRRKRDREEERQAVESNEPTAAHAKERPQPGPRGGPPLSHLPRYRSP